MNICLNFINNRACIYNKKQHFLIKPDLSIPIILGYDFQVETRITALPSKGGWMYAEKPEKIYKFDRPENLTCFTTDFIKFADLKRKRQKIKNVV